MPGAPEAGLFAEPNEVGAAAAAVGVEAPNRGLEAAVLGVVAPNKGAACVAGAGALKSPEGAVVEAAGADTAAGGLKSPVEGVDAIAVVAPSVFAGFAPKVGILGAAAREGAAGETLAGETAAGGLALNLNPPVEGGVALAGVSDAGVGVCSEDDGATMEGLGAPKRGALAAPPTTVGTLKAGVVEVGVASEVDVVGAAASVVVEEDAAPRGLKNLGAAVAGASPPSVLVSDSPSALGVVSAGIFGGRLKMPPLRVDWSASFSFCFCSAAFCLMSLSSLRWCAACKRCEILASSSGSLASVSRNLDASSVLFAVSSVFGAGFSSVVDGVDKGVNATVGGSWALLEAL